MKYSVLFLWAYMVIEIDHRQILSVVDGIAKKLYFRTDADDEDEEEDKPKKKASGWGTRLPYGLCSDLGIDTTGMTPHDAWEAYEGATGKSAKATYTKKKKSPDKKIYVTKKDKEKAKEKYGVSDDKKTGGHTVGDIDKYTSMTKEDLDKEFEDKVIDFKKAYKDVYAVHGLSDEKLSFGADEMILEDYGEEYTGSNPEYKMLDDKLKEISKIKSAMKAKGYEYKIPGETTVDKPKTEAHDIPESHTYETNPVTGYHVPKMNTEVKSLKNWQDAENDYMSKNMKDGKLWGKYDKDEVEKIQGNLQGIFDNADLAANFNSKNLASILQTGYKNQFETGTTDGCSNLTMRRKAAKNLWGMSTKMDSHDREKYGYIVDKDNYDESLGASGPHYGSPSWSDTKPGCRMMAIFKKDKIADRTTWTGNDSLIAYEDKERNSYAAGAFDTKCSVSGLSYGETGGYYLKGVKTKGLLDGSIKNVSQLKGSKNSYIEAQFHGDVTADDISELRFKSKSDCYNTFKNFPKEAADIIVNKGIKISFFDDSHKVEKRDLSYIMDNWY